MKPLDDELRNLFRRKEPSEGFAERVLAGLDKAPQRLNVGQRIAALLRRPTVRWVAAPAACALVALSVVRYRHQQRVHARAEQASREAIVALRITNAELEAALQRAQRATMQVLKVSPKSEREME